VQPQVDLWYRLAQGYQLKQCEYPEAQGWAEYYAQRTALTDRILERAEPWMALMLEAIEARDLPHELVFVPAIESAFYPFAYSHGAAAGMWQFVAPTARQQELTIDWWYDGRRDVLAATEAALDYLGYLGNRFDGNWSLALSAYNGGQGRVTRALRRHGGETLETPGHELRLPRETLAYVPKLMGFACLMAEPERFGYQRKPLSIVPKLAVITSERALLLPKVAEVAGMDMDSFHELNPGFNRWVTPPRGPHRVVIPADALTQVRSAMQAGELFDDITWQRHRVVNGDTLGGIARRYGIPIQVIRDTNQMGNSSMIRAGSHLLIPIPSAGSAEDLSERLVAMGAYEHASDSHYQVQRGDSLWRIANSVGTTVADLRRWNELEEDAIIRPGQSLRIRSGEASSTLLSEANRQRSIRYRVRRGDSLWSIAQKFNVSPRQIRRWNDLTKDMLQPGQRLQLVVDLLETSG
jgi:membrane-bound lytic murein transglycosylase D